MAFVLSMTDTWSLLYGTPFKNAHLVVLMIFVSNLSEEVKISFVNLTHFYNIIWRHCGYLSITDVGREWEPLLE